MSKFNTVYKKLLAESFEDRENHVIRSVGIDFNTMEVIDQSDGVTDEKDIKYFYEFASDPISATYEVGFEELERSLYFYCKHGVAVLTVAEAGKIWDQAEQALEKIKQMAPKRARWFLWSVGKANELRFGYEDTNKIQKDRLKANVGDDDELGLVDLFDNL